MTEYQLAAKLKDVYRFSKQRYGGHSLVLLFGVVYAEQLSNVSEVVRQAGIPDSLKSEVSKGKGIARYVVPNDSLPSELQRLFSKL